MRSKISLLLLVFTTCFYGQTSRSISGTITDATTKEPLAFSTVGLKKNHTGIIANESGQFEFFIAEDSNTDTLIISYFGYQSAMIPVTAIKSPLNIGLKSSAIVLNEVVVKPQPAEYYVRLAMQRLSDNYSQLPFETQAYYREKVTENKNFIKCQEGIFKTYCQNYLDTAQSQNQLLLFREEKNTHEVAFKQKEIQEAKEKKERKKEKRIKKGKSVDTTSNNSGLTIDMHSAFSGPDQILKQGNLRANTENFLDTNKFKNYRFSFAKSSSYDSKELMVIEFSSRGKVDHVKESGKIYIETGSFAIARIERAGDLIIPVIIKPVLFLYRIGVDNPTFEEVIQFQKINNKWYPQNLQNTIDIKLINKHWFASDEVSDFHIEGIYAVNKTAIDGVAPIAKAKRFDAKKEMEKQVHNDENLTWNGINIIKK